MLIRTSYKGITPEFEVFRNLNSSYKTFLLMHADGLTAQLWLLTRVPSPECYAKRLFSMITVLDFQLDGLLLNIISFFFSVSKTQIFLKWFNSMVDCLLTPHSLSRDCCHCLSTCTAPGLAPVSCWHISTRLRFHQFTGWSSHSSLISSHNQPCKSEFEWAGPLCWTIFFYSVCGAVLLFHVITACDRH